MDWRSSAGVDPGVIENRGLRDLPHATIAGVDLLDNHVWHALTGPHAAFSQGRGLALRYQPDVAVFSALPDEAGPDAFAALAALVGPGATAVLSRPAPLTLPAGWEITVRMNSLQMVATEPIGAPDESFARLRAGDVEEMLALVERNRPGPFRPRTIELGTYIGHREGLAARLVAMAGERVHLSGYTEVSAVCTDDEARKRGLATRLVRAVAAGIEGRGETPVLHVLAENHAAVRVYESLGFEIRAAFETLIVRAPI